MVRSTLVGQVGYGTASARDRARFTPVAKASVGLLSLRVVHSVNVSGRDVGAVAVYRLSSRAGTSSLFKDQYVVQVVNAASGTQSVPRFVRANGVVVAVSDGPVPVAGWIQGSRLTLLYRHSAGPDLAGLAAAVSATPPRA